MIIPMTDKMYSIILNAFNVFVLVSVMPVDIHTHVYVI